MTGNSEKIRRPRLNEDQIAEIKRLYRKGVSQTEIARRMKRHRQTIRFHLKERQTDAVAESARKDVLAEGLRRHFLQLSSFTANNFRTRLHASTDKYTQRKSTRSHQHDTIIISGTLALPSGLGAIQISEEWLRMYSPSTKDIQLLKALREHTKDSPLWTYWDDWWKRVAKYEESTTKLFNWVDEKIEKDISEIDITRLIPIRNWIFGNILMAASKAEYEDIDDFRKSVFDPKGVIIGREPGVDMDGSESLFGKLSNLIEQAKKEAAWKELQQAEKELSRSETQSELRRLVKKMDDALAGIELMHAFPGHCDLCPI